MDVVRPGRDGFAATREIMAATPTPIVMVSGAVDVHADPAVGRFANDASLTDKDKADLLGWIAAGAPEGDPADAPLPSVLPQ